MSYVVCTKYRDFPYTGVFAGMSTYTGGQAGQTGCGKAMARYGETARQKPALLSQIMIYTALTDRALITVDRVHLRAAGHRHGPIAMTPSPWPHKHGPISMALSAWPYQHGPISVAPSP